MTLRAQFTAALGGVAALSFLASGLIATFVSGGLLTQTLSVAHSVQAELFGLAAGAALPAGSEAALREYMGAMPRFPGIAYAYVAAPGGQVMLHSDRALEGRDSREMAERAASQGVIEYSAAFALPGAPGLAARVGVPGPLARVVFPLVGQGLRTPLAVMGAAGLALSLGLGAGLAWLLVRPIHRLASAAREVGRGDLSVQVPPASGELGELGSRFNDMVRRLKELDELKGRFVASVSHDLRSPMAAIVMYVDHMLEADPERDKILPKHKRQLAIMRENAMRLSVFVSNILDAAKMRAGRLEYKLQPVLLEPVFKSVRDLFAMMSETKKVALEASLPRDLPPVSADREPLERALANLVSNALKFTGSGGSVRLSASRSDGRIEVSVSDTGRGIPAQDLSRLFKPFEQAASPGGGTQGTGLGLYIVKQAVEGMGGTVSIDSKPGRGTTVTLSLREAHAS